MGSACNWEKSTIANELIQGMEVARQLKFHLSSSTSSADTQQRLLQRILSSYDNALLLLNWSESSAVQPQAVPAVVSVPQSPISTESPGEFRDHHQDVSKKRKALPTWKDHMRIFSENGVESSADDGYSWRKYGQKDILGATYPRSYYRCAYRNTQNCYATKQVQRSDNDPTIFEITYRGKHTCLQASNSAPPATPENQELKHDSHRHYHHHQEPTNDVLINFREALRVETDDLHRKEASDSFSFPHGIENLTSDGQLSSFSQLVNENLMGNFSPSFISPATSGSSYFSVSPYQMNSFGQFPESDHNEIISANTSTTNSPILDLDFQIENVDLDPKFPFDTPGFF